MYNTKSGMNTTSLMARAHGVEAAKSAPIRVPSNVRLIMACKPMSIVLSSASGVFELICNRQIKDYPSLGNALLTNKHSDKSMCVFHPGTLINEMILQGDDGPGRYVDSRGKIEFLNIAHNSGTHGIFELGTSFTITDSNGEPVVGTCKRLAKYLSGNYIHSMYEDTTIVPQGMFCEWPKTKRIKLSALLDELLDSYPNGFTFVMFVCRGQDDKTLSYIPRGVRLPKDLKTYKKRFYTEDSIQGFKRVKKIQMSNGKRQRS